MGEHNLASSALHRGRRNMNIVLDSTFLVAFCFLGDIVWEIFF